MMPRIPRFMGAALAAQAAVLIVAFAGCGDSGAKLKPTVTVRPASKTGGGGESAATGNGNKKVEPGSTAAPAAGGYGTFAGQIILKGDAPKLAALVNKGDPAAKDMAVCAAEAVPDESLVVGEGNGIANVFVYLGKPPAGAKEIPPETEPAIFDQKFCRFKPHALAVRTDRPISVLNDDGVAHNTHTYPVDGDNPAINPILPPNDRKGVSLTYVAQEKVPISVKCDIHNYMKAYHMPVSHPYFAVTDENGKFEIKDLPSGNHEFFLWQEKAGYLDRAYKVSITDGKTETREITVEASKFATWDGPRPKVLVVKADRH